MRSNIDKTAKFELNAVAAVVISCCAPFSNSRVMKDAKEKGVHFFHVPQDPVETTGADPAIYT